MSTMSVPIAGMPAGEVVTAARMHSTPAGVHSAAIAAAGVIHCGAPSRMHLATTARAVSGAAATWAMPSPSAWAVSAAFLRGQ